MFTNDVCVCVWCLVVGFTAIVATGPFSTSDSLDMAPLNDIITITREEQPDILLLVKTIYLYVYIIDYICLLRWVPTLILITV